MIVFIVQAQTKFDWPSIWDAIVASFEAVGVVNTLFAAFFCLAHYFNWRLYKGNINDKQGEIDRIAEDHRALREENKQLRDELRRLSKQLRK